MTVDVYMYPKEKINYDKSLFENYYLGLYKTYYKVVSVKDCYLDYRLYDKEDDIITSISKKNFFLKIQ